MSRIEGQQQISRVDKILDDNKTGQRFCDTYYPQCVEYNCAQCHHQNFCKIYLQHNEKMIQKIIRFTITTV